MTTRLALAALVCIAAMAGSAIAQETGAVVIHKEVRAIAGEPGDVMMYHPEPITMDFLGAEMSFGDKAVKSAPYSAEAVTETTQTLADGNRITHKSSASVYRDSAGRTRREETLSALGPWAAGGDAPKVIFIQDPAASTGYHLDPQTHVAHKMPMGKGAFFFSNPSSGSVSQKNMTFQRALPPPPGAAEVSGAMGAVAGLAVPGAKMSKADVKTESLSKQTIEGLEVEGSRSTMTMAAGSIGNEMPISSVTERWYSQELQAVVMSKRSDPRFGETVYRLTNIQRGEQPASLFEVPADYTITENELPQMIKKIQTVKPAEESK